MQWTMKFSCTKWVLTGLVVALPAACSSSDEAELEKSWPDLSDIQPAPALTAGATEPESVIQALREEAERRRSEGYQAPEIAPQATPAPAPDASDD